MQRWGLPKLGKTEAVKGSLRFQNNKR